MFSARRKWEISESFADFWPGSSSLERCRRCPDTGSSSRIFNLPASAKPARKLAVRFRSFWFLQLCLKRKYAAYLDCITYMFRVFACSLSASDAQQYCLGIGSTLGFDAQPKSLKFRGEWGKMCHFSLKLISRQKEIRYY